MDILSIFSPSGVYLLILLSIDFIIYCVDRKHGPMKREDELFAASAFIVNTFTFSLGGLILVKAFSFLEAHSLFKIELPFFLYFLVVFFLKDLTVYFCHRLEHQTKFFWAFHRIHHSITTMNLRSGSVMHPLNVFSLYTITNLIFVYIGFDAIIVLLVKQIFTFHITFGHFSIFNVKDKPSILSQIFITPSNHRVHHGTQPRYYNKNFGAVLTIFDRVFGTFQLEDPNDPPIFGLVGATQTKNVWIESTVGFKEIFKSAFTKAKPSIEFETKTNLQNT
jgi:sterol desaturase/sphingolipid hydroxylase (fatty acid hydroxylase superfamily)